MTTLETPRLLLRRFTLEDLEDYFQLGARPALVRYVGGKTLASLDEARAILLAAPLRDYEVHGYGRLACIEKRSGRLIGFNGLKFDPALGETDLGYRFLEDCWGQGYATESSRAVMTYGRDVLQLPRIVGAVHPENVASVRVLSKVGMVYEKKVRYEADGEEFDLYVMQR